MKAIFTLPEHYREIGTIDSRHPLRHNSLLLLWMILTAVGVFIPLQQLDPMPSFYPADALLKNVFLPIGALLVMIFAYALLHGIVCKLGGVRYTRHRAKRLPVFVRDKGYMPKRLYILLDAVPALLLAALLLLACGLAPQGWGWPIGFALTALAVKEAADLCVWIRLMRMPRQTLIKEVGATLVMYIPS